LLSARADAVVERLPPKMNSNVTPAQHPMPSSSKSFHTATRVVRRRNCDTQDPGGACF
jgi:hypothetical protein